MEYQSGNIMMRPMFFEYAGEVMEGHHHNFDHTTVVFAGSALIERLSDDGVVERAVTVKADSKHNWVLIKAKSYHRITALEDNTRVHCIYSHRNPQAEIVEEYDGWAESYV
jgi:hypothetical protein